MGLKTIRSSGLPTFSFIIYLLTLVLLLSEVDRQYYQVEKEAVIKYNFRTLFPHDTQNLQDVARQILVQHDAKAPVYPGLETEWRELAQGMISGEGCVFQIKIVPRDGKALLVQRDDAKFRRLNGFKNTLFYRRFQNVVSYEIRDGAALPWIGLLSFHYTTPRDYPPIVSLTNRYRLWCLLLFAAVTVCYAYLARQLILPTKRVVDRIDAASSSAPRIMPYPSSLLEGAYNNLARDAILLRMEHSIRNMTAKNPTFDRSEVLARVPGLLVDLLGYRAVLVFDFSEEEAGEYSVASCVQATDGAGSYDWKGHCLEKVFLPAKIGGLVGKRRVDFGECVLSDITQPVERRHLSFLVVFLPDRTRKFDAANREWHVRTIDQSAEQLREILAVFDLQKRFILNERNRANINLARNLGHDLTNIIATSKLDIRTVMKLLQGTQDGVAAPVGSGKVLADAVAGLLNNTRLLQEVVNIYRSFSYIDRPRFKTVQVNRIVDEIIEMFSLSLPASTVVKRKYQEDLPACSVEPRLVKLALFNILTNAVDAIRQNSDRDRPRGVITISTGMDPWAGEICISIRDNGTGIRNSDGHLASQADIDRIFRYGFTTRTDDGGEGLGLSWVRTIVEDFHNGRIQAVNHFDGGAEFRLFIGAGTSHATPGAAHEAAQNMENP